MCESCLRSKPDRESVRVSWWMRELQGVSVPRGANLICRRCAGKVRRLGVVALIGLAVVNLFTLVILHVAKHHL